MSASAAEPFERDERPGAPRLLFIGSALSSHTHSWIRLLDGAGFNVRLFSPVPYDTAPPEEFRIQTYLTNPNLILSGAYCRNLTPPPPAAPPVSGWRRLVQGDPPPAPAPTTREAALLNLIAAWPPHVVHTLGLFDAGLWFHELRRTHTALQAPRWVLQLRGGSDLEINRFVPEKRARIAAAAGEADQILSDNLSNFGYLRELGVAEHRFSRIGAAPGTGGMDLPDEPPSGVAQRRTILWPKAYNTQFALAPPVIEALRLAWDRLPPCRIVMLWTVQDEVKEWLATLPEPIRAASDIRGQVPRETVLELLREARVLLAPSLVDGRPNSMLEAMTEGAFPIVSPLPTIREVASEPENVLFARNLYPDEIAAALVRAMTDDALVERAAAANLALLRRIADRKAIAARVRGLYAELAVERTSA